MCRHAATSLCLDMTTSLFLYLDLGVEITICVLPIKPLGIVSVLRCELFMSPRSHSNHIMHRRRAQGLVWLIGTSTRTRSARQRRHITGSVEKQSETLGC